MKNFQGRGDSSMDMFISWFIEMGKNDDFQKGNLLFQLVPDISASMLL